MKCPCHNCEQREPGCHISCAAYIDFKESIPRQTDKDKAMTDSYFVHKNSFRIKDGKYVRRK